MAVPVEGRASSFATKPMKYLYLLLLLPLSSWAQLGLLRGNLVDDQAKPLVFATVALLHDQDSTLAFFAISDGQGSFEIKNVRAGKYILQASFLGHKTYYKAVDFPKSEGPDLGTLVLPRNSTMLGVVNVEDEAVPIQIKNDTIEYNAASFKTREDAAVEELLRKLPGVEVDRSGNIKAGGENVKRVLVDGKEFFGDDPKVATKNLPADAIKKVQVYDQKSDEAELTGIDDGSREKTINLLLKDDKKQAWLGEMQLGGGSDERFKAHAKAFRFSRKHQFAALGMTNNINQFGFSMSDYISFNGGLSNLGGEGGGLQINGSLPVNFGQQETGLIRSGAAGLNYSYEPRKFHRFSSSYLANGAHKNLQEDNFSRNFLADGEFQREEANQQINRNLVQRLNLAYRNRFDTTQNLTSSAVLEWSRASQTADRFSRSLSNAAELNRQNSLTETDNDLLSVNLKAAYLKRFRGRWNLFRVSTDINYRYDLSEQQRNNLTQLTGNNLPLVLNQFQNNLTRVFQQHVQTSATYNLRSGYLLEPALQSGMTREKLIRSQGFLDAGKIDSLSPDFERQYQYIRPGLVFRKSTKKTQWSLSSYAEFATQSQLGPQLVDTSASYVFFLPRFNFEHEFRTGRRLNINYFSRVNAPGANQLLPVNNNLNPLSVMRGNTNLRPEQHHSLSSSFFLFDQFSFTSFFVHGSLTAIADKINWSRRVNPDLSQELLPVNVASDYTGRFSAEFSTPVRKLGITTRIRTTQTYNRGINLINGLENVNLNYGQEYGLTIENRKKEPWDIAVGATLSLSDARYSVQSSLNNRYSNVGGFAEVRFTPSSRWNTGISMDVTRYNAQSFNEIVLVPLVKWEMQYSILKARRGSLGLEVFDLLNKNTGVQRISELNYLQERRANIIGRYVMLSFKYRLNKFETGEGKGMDIRINPRR